MPPTYELLPHMTYSPSGPVGQDGWDIFEITDDGDHGPHRERIAWFEGEAVAKLFLRSLDVYRRNTQGHSAAAPSVLPRGT